MYTSVVAEDIRAVLGEPLLWEELNSKTVLVTGATGMVGQSIVATLLALKEHKKVAVNVIGLVRDEERARTVLGNDESLVLLVQDVAQPLEVSQDIDIIIHAASPASPDKYAEDPVGVMRANLLGSFNTLELARQKNAKYCFVSTMEVYGQVGSENEDVVLGEDDYGRINNLELRSAYPESKRAAETLAISYGAQYGVDYVIARMTHSYGPGMSIHDTRVQADFMKSALQGNDIVLKSDGSLRRTYTYISDVTKAIFYMLLVKSEHAVFNIANEDAKISIRELAETIVSIADNGTKLVFDIDESAVKLWSKTKNTYVDCSRLRELGWQATVSPYDGFKRTMQYHKER